MITDIEDYFEKGCGRCAKFATADCATRRWAQGLGALRDICRDAGLSETVKWGHPCYMHAGRNIALIGAFQGDFCLSFMNAALLDDPAGVLEKRGPNTRHGDTIRFTDCTQVSRMRPLLAAYLQEAMDHARAGTRPPKTAAAPDAHPEELSEALGNDPDLARAFHNLTPGRQRSYIINLNAARKAETRHARIVKFRDRIIAGKGAQER